MSQPGREMRAWHLAALTHQPCLGRWFPWDEEGMRVPRGHCPPQTSHAEGKGTVPTSRPPSPPQPLKAQGAIGRDGIQDRVVG